MIFNVCRLAIALVMMMQVAVTEVAAKTFKEQITYGNQQFKGKHQDRDYEGAKTAAIEAFKIAENTDEKSVATLLLGRVLNALKDNEAARTEYTKILVDKATNPEQKASAHVGIAETFSSEKDWMAARTELEKIFALEVSSRTKNNAQYQLLIAWRSQGELEELKAFLRKLPEGEKEAWSGRKLYTLDQASALLRSSDPAGSRECSLMILTLPGVKPADVIRALRSTATTHNTYKEYSDARKIWNKVLKSEGLSDREKLIVMSDIANSYIAESNYAPARKILDELAADHLRNDKFADYVSVQCTAAQTFINEGNYSLAVKMLEKGLAVEGLTDRMKADILFKMAHAYTGMRSSKELVKTIAQILDLEGLSVNEYRSARGNALDTWEMAATSAEKEQAASILERTLTALADHMPDSPPKNKLVLSLQAAGTYGLWGNLKTMDAKIDAVLNQAKQVDVPTQIEALWDAATFYINLREYEVGAALNKRKNALHDASKSQNTYACGFIASAPIGAGGWAQSDFIQSAKNKESRFQPYPSASEGSALIYDVAADRPLGAEVKGARAGRDTSFFMVGDIKGWHMYVQTDEPNVEQVMLQDGKKGSSSLEMFFSPGLERVAYYQWILRLGTGAVNLYNWHTPHRAYRNLKDEPGNFQVETAVVEKGWGTAIFIPWEMLYDKLPFMDGNDDTWRFSIMRWGPVSLSWGGRVHETSRWGLVNWQAPTAELKTAILRRLIKRGWWKYTVHKAAATEFWSCPYRGDPDFYENAVKPVLAVSDAYEEKIESIDTWNPNMVEDVFKNMVPLWMEFDYEVETLREKYLQEMLVP